MGSTFRRPSLKAAVLRRMAPPMLALCMIGWLGMAWTNHYGFVRQAEMQVERRVELAAAVAETRLRDVVHGVEGVAANSIAISALSGEDVRRIAKPYLDSLRGVGMPFTSLHLLDYRGRPIIGAGDGAWRAPEVWPRMLERALEGETAVAPVDGRLLYVAVPIRLGAGVEGVLAAAFEARDALTASIVVDVAVRVFPDDAAPAAEPDAPGFIRRVAESAPAFAPGLRLRAEAVAPTPRFFDNSAQIVLAAAFVGLALLAAFGVSQAASSLSAPVRALAQRIEKGGLEDADAAPSDPREIAVLTRRLVEAAHDAKSASEFQEALTRERELASQRREFVSMVSHEFRTPLAIIDAAAGSLRRRHGRMTDEQRLSKIDLVRGGVVRMVRLMEGMLLSHRLESRGLSLELKAVDIGGLVTMLVDERRMLSPDCAFVVDVAALPADIVADERLIISLVDNLLSNAVKYGGERPHVSVVGAVEGEEVRLSVSDTGVGIPPDELRRIGERFFRASTSAGVVGTGVGLNMVKAVADRHGGRLEVRSRLGEGSTFAIVLPKAGPTLDQSAQEPLKQATLRRVIYRSVARPGLDEATLNGIVVDSSRRNARLGVSGRLVHRNGVQLAQVLEGAPATIETLLARIADDPRHGDFKIVRDESVGERAFDGWRMGLIEAVEDDPVRAIVSSLEDRGDGDRRAEPPRDAA